MVWQWLTLVSLLFGSAAIGFTFQWLVLKVGSASLAGDFMHRADPGPREAGRDARAGTVRRRGVEAEGPGVTLRRHSQAHSHDICFVDRLPDC